MAGLPVDDRHESDEGDAVSVNTALRSWMPFYACPNCKSPLVEANGGLRCASCDSFFSIVDDIPEFIAGELSASPDPQLRRMRFIDKMASLYESRLWYPVVMKVYGGLRAPLLPELIRSVADILAAVRGRVLDVACGPGTFGRKIASPAREVWGIDVSRGILRQGVVYAAAERISNLHFARASRGAALRRRELRRCRLLRFSSPLHGYGRRVERNGARDEAWSSAGDVHLHGRRGRPAQIRKFSPLEQGSPRAPCFCAR